MSIKIESTSEQINVEIVSVGSRYSNIWIVYFPALKFVKLEFVELVPSGSVHHQTALLLETLIWISPVLSSKQSTWFNFIKLYEHWDIKFVLEKTNRNRYKK